MGINIVTLKRNPNVFRIIMLIFFGILFTIISISFYRNITTVFSGTNYVSLPSRLYINQQIIGKKSIIGKNGIQRLQWDTIPSGSFVININGNEVDNEFKFESYINNLPDDSIIKLNVFNITKAIFLSDVGSKQKYFQLTDTFYIKKSELPKDFINYLKGGIFIGYIENGGATDLAGIKPGDVLFTIDDKEMKVQDSPQGQRLTPESLRFLRSHKSGEILSYKILRNNQITMFQVRLASFGIQLIYLLLLISGLPTMILGLFFALKRPRIFAARITGIALTVLGFQICSSFIINPPDMDIFSYALILLTNVTAFMCFPLIFHSFIYFPKERISIIKNRYNILVPYFIGGITVVLFIIWFIIDYNSIIGSIFTGLVTINILYYFLIRLIHRKDIIVETKKMSGIIRWAYILSIGISLLQDLLMNLGISIFPKLFQYSFITLILIPIAYLYTTWRYRLLDIEFKLRRSVQYNIISFFWKLTLFILFSALLWEFSRLHIQFPNIKYMLAHIEVYALPLTPELNTLYEKIFIMILALFSFLLFIKLNRYGQGFVDKKYYRQKFDYRFAQSELMSLFESKHTLEDLAEIMVRQISELVHLKFVGLLFIEDHGLIWGNKMYCYENQKSTKYFLEIQSEIITVIEQFQGPSSIDYLPDDSKQFLLKNKFFYIVPIRTGNKLIGALFIGEKLSEVALKNEDIEFLTTIALNASVTIENVFLYEELTQQERLKRELEIARKIQMDSLPQKIPQLSGMEISAISIPCMEVGGDFYDFLNNTPNKLTIVVGDVSGKGTSAALYMSKIQGILQTLHEFKLSPADLLIRTNRLLYKHIASNSFVTAICANFHSEKNHFSFVRAGHLPILHFKKSIMQVEQIRPNGIGLGLSDEETFNSSIEEKIVQYEPGDIILFFSDGITESVNKTGIQFGEERLAELLIDNFILSSQQICNNIIDSLQKYSEGMDQFDDITLVVVKLNN